MMILVDGVVAYMHIFKCVSSFFMLHGLRPFLGVVISTTSTRFFLRRDLAAEGRDPQPFPKVHHVDGSNRSCSLFTSRRIFAFFYSLLPLFVPLFSFGVVRANALRRSAVTTEMTAFQSFVLFGHVREHHPVFYLTSSLSPCSCFYFLLLFLFLRKKQFLILDQFNAKSVVVFKDIFVLRRRHTRRRHSFPAVSMNFSRRVCFFGFGESIHQSTTTTTTTTTTLFLVLLRIFFFEKQP